tara:strand:- start:725 stop:841 length:117 start_codon:yes stop_codon:yes gene_type:complete
MLIISSSLVAVVVVEPEVVAVEDFYQEPLPFLHLQTIQ